MTDSFNYHQHGLQPQLSTNQGGPVLLQQPRGAPAPDEMSNQEVVDVL